MRDISYKLFEENTTSFDKFRIVVVLHFHVADINGVGHLLWNRGDVASGPPIGERLVEGFEFIESPLHGELTCGVAASDCVLGDFAHFLGVGDSEVVASLLSLILVVFDGALNLLSLVVEGEDLLDELRLGIRRPLTQVHFSGSHRLHRATSSCAGLIVFLYVLLLLSLSGFHGTLGTKAQWHTFFILVLNSIAICAFDFLRLVFLFLFFTSEELLLLLVSLVLLLSIWVRLGLVLLFGRLLILLLLRVIFWNRLLLLLLLLWSIYSHIIQATINHIVLLAAAAVVLYHATL